MWANVDKTATAKTQGLLLSKWECWWPRLPRGPRHVGLQFLGFSFTFVFSSPLLLFLPIFWVLVSYTTFSWNPLICGHFCMCWGLLLTDKIGATTSKIILEKQLSWLVFRGRSHWLNLLFFVQLFGKSLFKAYCRPGRAGVRDSEVTNVAPLVLRQWIWVGTYLALSCQERFDFKIMELLQEISV